MMFRVFLSILFICSAYVLCISQDEGVIITIPTAETDSTARLVTTTIDENGDTSEIRPGSEMLRSEILDFLFSQAYSGYGQTALAEDNARILRRNANQRRNFAQTSEFLPDSMYINWTQARVANRFLGDGYKVAVGSGGFAGIATDAQVVFNNGGVLRLQDVPLSGGRNGRLVIWHDRMIEIRNFFEVGGVQENVTLNQAGRSKMYRGNLSDGTLIRLKKP